MRTLLRTTTLNFLKNPVVRWVERLPYKQDVAGSKPAPGIPFSKAHGPGGAQKARKVLQAQAFPS